MAVGGWSGDQEQGKHQAHQAHQAHQEVGGETDRVARAVVDAGFRVHKTLGPGLLESVYEHCLVYELEARGLSLRRQAALPVRYGEVELDAGYRLDLIVEESVIVEIKTVETLTRLHEAQIMTCLRCSGCRIGFLMNFNVVLFKQGVRRLVL
jgi:GxxExxY protein